MKTSTDNLDLYNDTLMSYVSRIHPDDRLENPDRTASAYSPICGTEITIDLNTSNGKITNIGYDAGSACALTKTVLAIVLDAAINSNKAHLQSGLGALNALLENGVKANNEWKALNILIPAKDYTARHNSMRLPFEAAIKALS